MKIRTGYFTFVMLAVVALSLSFGVGCSKNGSKSKSSRPNVKSDGDKQTDPVKNDGDKNFQPSGNEKDRKTPVKPKGDVNDQDAAEFPDGASVKPRVVTDAEKKMTPPTVDYRQTPVGRDIKDIDKLRDQSIFPKFHASGITGFGATVAGERVGYTDLLADGVIFDLKNQLNLILDDGVRNSSKVLAQSVNDVQLSIDDHQVKLHIYFNQVSQPQPVLIQLFGTVNPHTRVATLHGDNGSYVFTGRLECLDTDTNHCRTARVGLWQWRDMDGRPGLEVCKHLFFVHRHGNAAVELPEYERQTYEGSGNKEFSRFIRFIDNTILVNHHKPTRAQGDTYASVIGLRTWAVAEGPAKFVVTMTALESVDGQSSRSGSETSFSGPLLAGIKEGGRNLRLDFGSEDTFGRPTYGDGSGAFTQAFRDVWLNNNGTNGVVSVGIMFKEPADRVDLHFFSLFGRVSDSRNQMLPDTPCQAQVHSPCVTGTAEVTIINAPTRPVVGGGTSNGTVITHEQTGTSHVGQQTKAIHHETRTVVADDVITTHQVNGDHHVDTVQSTKGNVSQAVRVETKDEIKDVKKAAYRTKVNNRVSGKLDRVNSKAEVKTKNGHVKVQTETAKREGGFLSRIRGRKSTAETRNSVDTVENGQQVKHSVRTRVIKSKINGQDVETRVTVEQIRTGKEVKEDNDDNDDGESSSPLEGL